MVLSSLQLPAGVRMQAQIHQPHTQLVQADHRFANPNSPPAPLMTDLCSGSLDQVTRHI